MGGALQAGRVHQAKHPVRMGRISPRPNDLWLWIPQIALRWHKCLGEGQYLRMAIHKGVVRLLPMAFRGYVHRIRRSHPEMRHDMVSAGGTLREDDGVRRFWNLIETSPSQWFAGVVIVRTELEKDVHTVPPSRPQGMGGCRPLPSSWHQWPEPAIERDSSPTLDCPPHQSGASESASEPCSGGVVVEYLTAIS